MLTPSPPPSSDEFELGRAPVPDGSIHYIQLGRHGSPVLLLHGFPETSRAFEPLMRHLAKAHRVFAPDLRGFGRSSVAPPGHCSASAAEDLHALISHLGVGPMHLLAQDIAGTTALRLAVAHPEHVLSVAALETGLPGFGLEMLADFSNGGAWYVGVLATDGAADTFCAGRERELLFDFIMPTTTARMEAVSTSSLEAIVSDYARPGGWSGARALYSSMLREGEEIRSLLAERPLKSPLIAVDRQGSDFTLKSFGAAHGGEVVHATIEGVGHYIALEAPAALADVLLPFMASIDAEA